MTGEESGAEFDRGKFRPDAVENIGGPAPVIDSRFQFVLPCLAVAEHGIVLRLDMRDGFGRRIFGKMDL